MSSENKGVKYIFYKNFQTKNRSIKAIFVNNQLLIVNCYQVGAKSFQWNTFEQTIKRWANVFNALDLPINDAINITN